MPNSVILMYDRGDVTVRNGVVAEVNLLAPEVYAKKTAREAAEKIEHEADNAETQAMRKSLLSDPNYLSLSTRDRIIALKEFEREHPDADVEADLEALLAVYDTELSQENNLAQLEQQLAQAQQQAEAAEQAAASAQQAAATAEQAAAAAEQQAAQQTATGAPSTSSTVLVVGSGYGPPRITPYASLYQINSQFIGSYRPPNGSVTVTQNGSGSHGSGSTSPPPTLNAGPSPLTPARPAPAAPGVIPRVGLVPVSGNG